MLKCVLSLTKVLSQSLFGSFRARTVSNRLTHCAMQLIAKTGDWLWFWYSAYLANETFPVLPLFFRFIQKERFRLEVVYFVDFCGWIINVIILHVNNAALLKIFEVEIRIS